MIYEQRAIVDVMWKERMIVIEKYWADYGHFNCKKFI